MNTLARYMIIELEKSCPHVAATSTRPTNTRRYHTRHYYPHKFVEREESRCTLLSTSMDSPPPEHTDVGL